MIDHLKGRLHDSGHDGSVVVECSGIGFRVAIPSSTRDGLPRPGELVTIKTVLHLRENISELFGFLSDIERDLFTALTGIGGVGPRLGLAVLSTLGVEGAVSAGCRGDAAMLVRVPGIGKKLAQRIALELPDRLKKSGTAFVADEDGVPSAGHDVVDALAALGFGASEALSAAGRVAKEAPGAPVDEAVRMALKLLAPKR